MASALSSVGCLSFGCTNDTERLLERIVVETLFKGRKTQAKKKVMFPKYSANTLRESFYVRDKTDRNVIIVSLLYNVYKT